MRSVVLFSGGQDSTTVLFGHLARGFDVSALSFDYGQRHRVETEAAVNVLSVARAFYPKAKINHEIIKLGPVLNGTSPLVSSTPLGQYESAADLPGGIEPTFVPARNLLFLTLALNRAIVSGAETIGTGVCEADFGGYPDCRDEFIRSFEQTASFAVGARVTVDTPLMFLTKRETVTLAASIPGCLEALAHSHTCYAGAVPPCGRCHACIIRSRGFEEAGVPDPLLVRGA